MTETRPSDLDIGMLLCTRLCHDLAGPVGAMSAGADLLADESDSDFIAETVHLLRHSADAASARLNVLRAAFGTSGRLSGTGTAQTMARAYLAAVAGEALPLAWEEDAPDLGDQPEAIQLLLNMVLVAVEAAHGRGRLAVAVTQRGEGLHAAVTVEGRGVALSEAALAALNGEAAGLTARTVQFYWTHRLSAMGGGLSVDAGDGCLRLSAMVPATVLQDRLHEDV